MAWPLSSLDWVRMALGLAVVGLVGYAYFGQKVEGPMSCYDWLTQHWTNISNYSHGPLIPLIAGGLVWLKRHELLRVAIRPVVWGHAVILLAMVLYYFGVKGGQPRVVVLSFVLLLDGVTLALGGRALHRLLFFPITFLLLMVPLNFLDNLVGFPLRMLVAGLSTGLLNWLGIQTIRVGTAIHSSVFSFDVADPCSGIRSLMALTTVTAAYAYVTQHGWWRRWALFLSAMPLAVLGNLMRVLSIAMVAQVYGQEVATRAYHDYSGYIVFAVALSAMVIFGILLNFPYRQVVAHWLQPLQTCATVNPHDNSPKFDEPNHE
jgi:exosortase